MISIKELPKELNPAVYEKMMEKKVRKEYYLFLALCPEHEKEILTSKEELTLYDFEKIEYLMYELGFDYLRNDFLMQHPDLLKESGCKVAPQKAIEDAEKWRKEFIEQISDDRVKIFVRAAMNVD